jgi:dTDP-4-dehydrorhamnose 3,5-epimerase
LKVTPTSIPDVLVIEPKVFGDDRGFFYESFNQKTFNEATGLNEVFVQDNHSRSTQGVLRGLHYQLSPFAQGKLVRVVQGNVWDVAVDVRKNSKTLGQWFGLELSAENKKQLWIPAGFAHGFITLSETADFLYKTNAYYDQASERSIFWNDSTISIAWPIDTLPSITAVLVNHKDAQSPSLLNAELY